MARGISTLLGIGLILFWASGLNAVGVTAWLPWMDFIAAGVAFVIAALPMSQTSRAGSCFALAIGLLALWLIAYSTNVTPWFCWWNFGFGFAYVFAGLVAGTERENLIFTLFGRREYYGDRLGQSYHVPYGIHARNPHLYDLEKHGHYLDEKYFHRKQYGNRGPGGYERASNRIREEIEERLVLNHLTRNSHIHVHVDSGVVILRGEATDPKAKRLAESIADSVWGVKEVKNELSLRSRAKQSSRRVA